MVFDQFKIGNVKARMPGKNSILVYVCISDAHMYQVFTNIYTHPCHLNQIVGTRFDQSFFFLLYTGEIRYFSLCFLRHIGIIHMKRFQLNNCHAPILPSTATLAKEDFNQSKLPMKLYCYSANYGKKSHQVQYSFNKRTITSSTNTIVLFDRKPLSNIAKTVVASWT